MQGLNSAHLAWGRWPLPACRNIVGGQQKHEAGKESFTPTSSTKANKQTRLSKQAARRLNQGSYNDSLNPLPRILANLCYGGINMDTVFWGMLCFSDCSCFLLYWDLLILGYVVALISHGFVF